MCGFFNVSFITYFSLGTFYNFIFNILKVFALVYVFICGFVFICIYVCLLLFLLWG